MYKMGFLSTTFFYAYVLVVLVIIVLYLIIYQLKDNV